MHTLIQDSHTKYILKSISMGELEYKTIFQYTGRTVVDAHEAIVGFKTQNGESHTGIVYLPSVRDDGILQRNKSLWYPVHMVIPPLQYRAEDGRIRYAQSLLSDNAYASKLADFFPVYGSAAPLQKTPLYRALQNMEAVSVHDTASWIAIDTAYAIIEMFNMKIISDIARSRRNGFAGIRATTSALHTLIRSFIRYHGEDDSILGYDEIELGEFDVLGKIASEDRKGYLVIHELIKSIAITPDTPIDFCTCSQSHPMTTARIKSGVTIQDCRFTGTADFPYTYMRKATVGILNDDPHRVIVSRAITRALKLHAPDKPYAETEVEMSTDSVSLPGIRMSHPLNYEDGMVVSSTFAGKCGAYKVVSDKVTFPKAATAIVMKTIYDGDILAEAKTAHTGTHVVKRNETIMQIVYPNKDKGTTVKDVRASVRATGILVDIDIYDALNDLGHEDIVYRFVYLLFLPLCIGDKIADAHGNKCTVSAIVDDADMPVWTGDAGMKTVAHYIAPPEIMKRLAVGAEIEDKLALIGYHRYSHGYDDTVMIDSDTILGIGEVDDELREYGISYTGTVRYQEAVYTDIPLSFRRIFRLDNNAVESSDCSNGVMINNNKRTSKNVRLGVDIVTMLSRKSANIAHWLIRESGSKAYTREHVIPILYAVADYIPEGASVMQITEKLPREILGNPIPEWKLAIEDPDNETPEHAETYNFENTPCDPRMEYMYGLIKLSPTTSLVVPPHAVFVETGIGKVMPSPVAVAANRVIAEVLSASRFGSAATNVPAKVERYKNTLSSMLAGKHGLLRKAVLPVFPVSIRGVASPYVSDDPSCIMIPRRKFEYLMRSNEEFRSHYSDLSTCLIKRDPVHNTRSLVAVRFKTWEHDTIGIHPLLIGVMKGDYDGDEVSVMFPFSALSIRDMEKMKIDVPHYSTMTKRLTDVPAEQAVKLLPQLIGYASTFRNPHPTDVSKNPEFAEKLINGLDMESVSAECVKAIHDFVIIKDGTAFTGAMCLRFIYTRNAEKANLLDEAMNMYGVMAQNTLNAKAGEQIAALNIVQGFNDGDEKLIQAGLANLEFTDTACINELVKFSKTLQLVKSNMRKMKISGETPMQHYLRKRHPVTAAIQSNAGYNEIREIASRLVNGEPMGDGVWDTLFDSILERTEKNIYDFTFSLDVIKEQFMEA